MLSSSSDCTIKVWVATEEGTLKVTYTRTEENVSYLTIITSVRKIWFYVKYHLFVIFVCRVVVVVIEKLVDVDLPNRYFLILL